jgi:uncharacterized protein YdiU (UPF0061 family)
MNGPLSLSRLEQLTFDNRFVRELPGDSEMTNYRRQVLGACYSRVLPTPVAKPQLVSYAKEVAALLDLSESVCQSELFTQVFTGNALLDGMEPYATCYGGHQFGQWVGQLGDGRAINLGEIVNCAGQRWVLQLKGAGLTPYSRHADGLAVLRSSVREFLCSEAMFHLGVPTTRALSLTLTGEQVIRDMYYDGNPKAEPGAIVCRVAPSFTRFGHFQILAARGELDLLRQLLDYTIRTDFPQLQSSAADRYAAWFTEVCRRTAEMIVHWQRVGFVHGVMNTDNMSVLGLTIDYGPYGWLENYDPDWTPNTTDRTDRRYRFGFQPQIAFWNLAQLANAIYPLIKTVEPLQEAMDCYTVAFEQGWQTMMRAKLGLETWQAQTDDALIADLLRLLQARETDMTLFYRQLAKVDHADTANAIALFAGAYYQDDQMTPEYHMMFQSWMIRYRARLAQQDTPDAVRRERMNAVNPNYVLRNYLAQLAIDQAEQGDFSKVNELLELLRRPYHEQTGKESYAQKRPEWARERPGCSMLSCSS